MEARERVDHQVRQLRVIVRARGAKLDRTVLQRHGHVDIVPVHRPVHPMLSDHQRSTAQISLLERTGCVRREAVGIVAADAARLGEGLVEVGDIRRGLVVLGGRMLVPAHTPRESLGLRKEGQTIPEL